MTNEITENKNTDAVAQGAGETRVEKCVCGHDELNHFAFGEEPPRKSGCDAPNCECYGFTLPAVTAHPPQDAVAQARERLVLTFGGEGYTSLPEVEAELDALIEAVRAECADRVDVRVAVEGALCYDCDCESEGPKKCERVIFALAALEAK